MLFRSASQELLTDSEGARIALSGPEVPLSAEQVQPLAMILHELATNAIKYGALSVRDGRVEIDCAPVALGWSIVWREQGGPPVATPSRVGFGSRLVTRLAAELGGGVQFRWPPEGLQVELRVVAPTPPAGPDHPFIGALARGARAGEGGAP